MLRALRVSRVLLSAGLAVLALSPARAGSSGEAEAPRIAAWLEELAATYAPGAPGDDAAREPILANLERSRHALVLEVVAGRARAFVDLGSARAHLKVVARIGGSEEVDLGFGIARAVPTAAGAGAPAALGSALEACLARDDRAFDRVDQAGRRAPLPLREAAARALAASATLRGAEVLAGWAAADPEIECLALALVGRMARSLPRPVPASVTAAVHAVLADPERAGAREAMLAACRLDDFDAIPLLVERAGSPGDGARRDAIWALQQLSGLHLGDSASDWKSWLDAEERWWRERANDRFERLANGNFGEKTAALEDISRRRTHRHELAGRTALALGDADPRVVTLALQTLGALRSSVAIPAILEILSAPDPAQSSHAWQALQRITGLSLPPSPEAWRAACLPAARNG